MSKKRSEHQNFWVSFLIGAVFLILAALVIPHGTPTSATVIDNSEVSGLAVFGDSIKSNSDLVFFSLFLAVTGFIFVLIYFHFFSKLGRLKNKLNKSSDWLSEGPIRKSKKQYHSIFNLYLKLPDSKKSYYYHLINKIKDQLSRQIQDEHRLRDLLARTPGLNKAKQKQNYLKINQLYQKLPHKNQKQHYQTILQLKQSLEQV